MTAERNKKKERYCCDLLCYSHYYNIIRNRRDDFFFVSLFGSSSTDCTMHLCRQTKFQNIIILKMMKSRRHLISTILHSKRVYFSRLNARHFSYSFSIVRQKLISNGCRCRINFVIIKVPNAVIKMRFAFSR